MTLNDTYLDLLAETAGSSVGKTLGMVIRPLFIAAPGKTLVWGDWANIEARVLPWLAASPGAEEQLQVFRDSDGDKTKPDVYVFNAAQLLGRDPQEMWDAYLAGEKWAKSGRQSHGKVPVLSLGFGGGFGALMKMAVNYHVHVDEENAKAMVAGWRERNPWAKEFWGTFNVDRHGNLNGYSGLWGAANMAIRDPGTPYAAGRVAYVFDKSYLNGTLFCALPDGRLLTYPDCKWREREVKDKTTGETEVKAALWFRKSYGWSALWYGKLAENVTQAVAGSVMRETLVELDPEYSHQIELIDSSREWMPVIGHTHDEIVTEPDEADAEEAAGLLKEIMEIPAPWRADLPLVAEVTSNWYYTKTEEKYL